MVELTDPPPVEHGFVTGRFVTAKPDSIDDDGRYPDLRGMTGSCRFTPAAPIYLTEAAVVVEQFALPLNENGWLVDAESGEDQSAQPGAWLAIGDYDVEPVFPSARNFPKYRITVTDEHTKENPLVLHQMVPIVLPPRTMEITRVIDRQLAQTAAEEAEGYAEISASEAARSEQAASGVSDLFLGGTEAINDAAVASYLVDGPATSNILNGVVSEAIQPLSVTLSNHPSLAVIGDSITSYETNGLTAYCRVGSAMAGDRLLDWRVYATGGATTSQIRATHLPQVLAMNPRPAYCLVATGTNDLGLGYNLDQLKADHQELLAEIKTAGITPILWAPPPRIASETSANANTDEYVEYIYALAEEKNLEVLDAHTVLGDSAGHLDPALAIDSVHPNNTGHLILGRALREIIRRLLPNRVVPLVSSQYDAADQRGLFLLDSNSDGRADGVGEYGGATGTIIAGAAFGKWQRISAAPGASYSGALRIDFPVIEGHEYDIGYMLKADLQGIELAAPITWRTPSASLGNIDNSEGVRFPSVAKVLSGDTLHLFTRRVAPAGTTILRLDFRLNGTATGPSWAQMAQLTCRDRTSAGLA